MQATVKALGARVESLQKRLGDNLYSCILYGSAVRGNLVPGVSDINLLIVLRESTPEAHAVIAETIRGEPPIVPFILGLQGLPRSFRAFAIKFRSIQRTYSVLAGADPLKELDVPEATVRFEAEQVLRNLRLRAVHAFVSFGAEPKRYSAYLIDVTADVFVALSEPVRLEGVALASELAQRIPIIGETIGADTSILTDLLALKSARGMLSAKECTDYHGRLFRLLDKATLWLEGRWPI